MPLKKKQFGDEEIAIFDEAVIYKRGEYWHFRMWLNGKANTLAKASAPAANQQRLRKAKRLT